MVSCRLSLNLLDSNSWMRIALKPLIFGLLLVASVDCENLSSPRNFIGVTSVGTKVLFAGGIYVANGSAAAVVDVFDYATGMWSIAWLSEARGRIGATTLGTKAYFGGGTGYSRAVDIYDSVTGNWTSALLSVGRDGVAAAAAGTKVLFGGGCEGGGCSKHSNVVDIYDTVSGDWSVAQLSQSRDSHAAASAGPKILFGGGFNYTVTKIVDIYDTSTGKWSISQLSVWRAWLSATGVGDIAVFAGGYTLQAYESRVDIYNSTSNSWSTAELSQPRCSIATAVVGNKLIFAGGEISKYTPSTTVETYDVESRSWTTVRMKFARSSGVASSAGSVVMIASGTSSSVVEMYDTVSGTLISDCKFSNVSVSSNCTLICGVGTEVVHDTIIRGGISGSCPVYTQQNCSINDSCNSTISYPSNCTLSEWGSWSICDLACSSNKSSVGTSYRFRNVTSSGLTCDGSLFETQTCNPNANCAILFEDMLCKFSPWAYGNCTSDCPSIRTFTRSVIGFAGSPGSAGDINNTNNTIASCRSGDSMVVSCDDRCQSLPDYMIPASATASVIVVVIIAGIVVFSLRKRCNSRKMLFDRFGTIDPMPKDILEFLLMSGAPHKKLFDGTVVFKRSLSPEMQSYRLAIDLLESLDGKRICDCIVSVHGVVNPRILNNFDGFRSILVQRFQNDPALFRKADWMSLADSDLRANVIHHYGTIVQKRDWNKFNCLVPIVPVVHGTDLSVAWKIVNTGFSALSSLDAGFYGRGIYFSSSALYTLPYYASKPNPCLILCLAIPGNVYPVVENHQGSHSLLGLPIKAGYQSNYVLTTKDGRPCATKLPSGSFYDELVLDQEAQVVPIAIIEFDAVKLAPIAQNFQREIARM